MVTIRHTLPKDLPTVLEIVEQSKQTMRNSGNMKQWTNGNPKPALFENDIKNGNSYVCVDDCDNIVGTFAYIVGEDPTYKKIYEGNWLDTSGKYGVIHRIASKAGVHGIASICIDWCFSKLPNLRIDTHRDNTIMQHILKKNGFSYCGIIYLLDGDERLAFQKVL